MAYITYGSTWINEWAFRDLGRFWESRVSALLSAVPIGIDPQTNADQAFVIAGPGSADDPSVRLVWLGRDMVVEDGRIISGEVTGLLQQSYVPGEGYVTAREYHGFMLESALLFQALTTRHQRDDIAVWRSLTAGDDSIYGTQWGDTEKGANGHDVIVGGGGNDLLFGNRGNDVLNGGGDHDSLNGGPGRDALEGGTGHNSLTGGAGRDTFHFNDRVGRGYFHSQYNDVIQDFEPDQDVIVFNSSSRDGSFETLVLRSPYGVSGGREGVVIELRGPNFSKTVELVGVEWSDLSPENILIL